MVETDPEKVCKMFVIHNLFAIFYLTHSNIAFITDICYFMIYPWNYLIYPVYPCRVVSKQLNK